MSEFGMSGFLGDINDKRPDYGWDFEVETAIRELKHFHLCSLYK